MGYSFYETSTDRKLEFTVGNSGSFEQKHVVQNLRIVIYIIHRFQYIL